MAKKNAKKLGPTLPAVSDKETAKGPHGGGNKYQQMTLGKQFITINQKPAKK